MLMKSDINPFDSQETKPYKNDPEILAMTNLVSAYQNNDINEFERILRTNRKTIMDDPFIREHIEGLMINYFKDISTGNQINLIRKISIKWSKFFHSITAEFQENFAVCFCLNLF